jgi:hypothetical protein
MNRENVKTIAFTSFALVVVMSVAWQARAQDLGTKYTSMAPLDQYLPVAG